MFSESINDPLSRFRSIDQKVDTLRDAVAQVRDAREMIKATEASEVRDKVLREEVLDFLDTATRQAATVLKELQESKTTLTDAKVRREMVEFLDQTRAVAERLITDLKNERRKILHRAQATLKSEKSQQGKPPAAKPHAAKSPQTKQTAEPPPPVRAPRAVKPDAPKERAPRGGAPVRKIARTDEASLKSIVQKPSRRKR